MTQVLDIFHSPPMDPPPWVDYGLTQNFRHEIEKNDRIIKTLVEVNIATHVPNNLSKFAAIFSSNHE